jgi:transcriptional regulator with XRE-family HTH domain
MDAAESPPMAAAHQNQLPPSLRDEMRPENIGRRLMLIREAHDLKPAEISDMLGIERTYWSRFEGGKRAITDGVAAMLVDRFGVTLDFIILGKWDRLPLELAEKMRRISVE